MGPPPKQVFSTAITEVTHSLWTLLSAPHRPPAHDFTLLVVQMLHIKHPVLLAGMNAVAHAELAAAVSNAGGLGVIGGL